jgi:hypothetical protein
MVAEINTRTIDVNLPATVANEFERRADSMQLFTSEYCCLILADWLASGKRMPTV